MPAQSGAGGFLESAVFLLLAIAIGSALATWRIERARDAEKTQRQIAEARAAETRERMARLKVAEGWRLVEQGGWFEALTPFVEALALEAGDANARPPIGRELLISSRTGPNSAACGFPAGRSPVSN